MSRIILRSSLTIIGGGSSRVRATKKSLTASRWFLVNERSRFIRYTFSNLVVKILPKCQLEPIHARPFSRPA